MNPNMYMFCGMLRELRHRHALQCACDECDECAQGEHGRTSDLRHATSTGTGRRSLGARARDRGLRRSGIRGSGRGGLSGRRGGVRGCTGGRARCDGNGKGSDIAARQGSCGCSGEVGVGAAVNLRADGGRRSSQGADHATVAMRTKNWKLVNYSNPLNGRRGSILISFADGVFRFLRSRGQEQTGGHAAVTAIGSRGTIDAVGGRASVLLRAGKEFLVSGGRVDQRVSGTQPTWAMIEATNALPSTPGMNMDTTEDSAVAIAAVARIRRDLIVIVGIGCVGGQRGVEEEEAT